MRTRTFVMVLLVVALATAGCLDGVDRGPAPSTSPAGSPDGSPTDGGGFEPASFADGPKDVPERPGQLTERAVSEYVRTFEYRRAYNSLWMGEGTDVTLDCETRDVEATDGGYEVLVSCTGYANSGGERDPNSTATPTVVHADWFTQQFVYRVTDGGIERRRATEDERSTGSL